MKPPARRAPASAYIALIMAVVPCCPFVSLAGGFLGLLVLSRMQKSGAAPNAPGRKVAIAAAIIGLLVAIASTGLFTWWQHRMDSSFRREAVSDLEQVIQATMAGDTTAARNLWLASGSAPTNDEFMAFGQTLQQRYGRFQRFAIDSFEFGGAALAPTIDVSGVFTFETRELAGSAKLILRQSGSPFNMNLAIMRLLIEDRTFGDLVLSD